MSSGNGPRSFRQSRVGASNGESWRLAPARTRPRGMPYPSVMPERFRPCLPRSTGERLYHLAASRGFGDRAVDGDLVEDEADDSVVGLQRDLLEPGEDAESYPLVAAVADRGGRAGCVGDRLVGAAEAQKLQQFVEDDPVADARAVAAQRMVRVVLRPLGQQGRQLVPERFGQP